MSTILITGANKGLGHEAARRLVAARHEVWAAARDPERGRAAAEDVHAHPMVLDVTDDASVRSATSTLAAATGGMLDVLINNAAISGGRVSAGDLTAEKMKEVYDVNVASLPKARGAQLHAAFAAWLERITGGGDERAAMLAHHYAEAVRPEDVDLAWAGREDEALRLRAKACDWCRSAARRAVGRYEIDTGIALLRRAVELEPDRGREAELWFEIGLANALRYDGPAFITAMERALELGAPEGAVYAELVYQGAQRAGMWNPAIDEELDAWVERALRVSAPGSLERAKALVADASQHERPDSAREALSLADTLGDDDLRSAALFTLVGSCRDRGDLDGMMTAVAQNIALLPRIADPDHRANIYVSAGSLTLLGRFAEVLQAAELLEQTTAGLTPHHRVHAAGMHVGVAVDMGRWARVCELTPTTEAAVAANLDTPCMINQSSLLLCAIGHEVAGDRDEARRLESKAEGFDLQGYDYEFDQNRLMLALSRGDIDRGGALVEKLYDESTNDHWLRIALLDGLLALGDHGRILKLAPAWVVPGTYLEPFALRALGAANDDESMVAHAIARFEAMGLDWHADQARKPAV